jgi:lipopolysaccharide biosynthesis glycosyltransferase
MYWFSAINDSSKLYKEMYLVALKSAIKNTTLKPILLYDGNDDIFCSEVENLSGKIIRHKFSLTIKDNYKKKSDDWKAIASGTFLRIDIPVICEKIDIKDNFVLYTDVDVLFMKDVVDELENRKPKYFSVCPETNKNDLALFNAGVMLINVKSMYDTYNEFTSYIDDNDYNFISYDQGALQTFYKDKVEELPLYFNHKPYWGFESNAKIIHYHGPKCHHISNYFNNTESDHIREAYSHLFAMTNKETWLYYYKLYQTYK